ncbi:hypothetical protein CLV28_1450 [Sediminihabitans luteus]|uniref:Uncharacterized protein n=1 Tax=Sediminihabitans luteus TaxID=1138585 RepID=A0A2M9CPX7_9CELL|nr:hypothetical protein [Sediminihabitans luteus]PJJ73966.1 hypothetical protein CLV28_1450 [Sediminihabitans luteus]GII98121.1 hypothetical protein Slu03_04990 [Sediminihabitans luteus]
MNTASGRHPVEGPAVPDLVRRLAATPVDLLDPRVHAPAALADLVELADGQPPRWNARVISQVDVLCGPQAPPVARVAALVAAWLVTAPVVRDSVVVRAALPGRLGDDPVVTAVEAMLTGPAMARRPHDWVQDPDGREEVARAFLVVLGLRGEGETAAESADRWLAVSTAERARLAGEIAVELRRAEELAARLAEQRAREAAARYTNH